MVTLDDYIRVFAQAVIGSTTDVVGDIAGIMTTPMLGETHLKRAAVGGAVLGAAALAPVIYPYVAPKARSKRSRAKREKEEKAVKELGEIAQKGVSKAFTTSAFALPATFLLLEVLASYPKEKIVHHPAEGYWKPVAEVISS